MIRYIDTYDAIRDLADDLRSCDSIALDTEAASFHRYSQRACLVQISTGAFDSLIDPLALPDLEPLRPMLVRSDLETVMHDADSDLRILDRDYGLRVGKVFDTRIAAQLLGEPGIGLAALLEKYLDTKLDKRFQRADWSIRPLSDEMMEYAASDTRHLHRLRDLLRTELSSRGRLAWADEEFARLPQTKWEPREPEADPHMRMAGVRALGPDHRRVARGLYGWRDATAKAMDRAPFRVMGNEHLVAIAAVAPKNLAELEAVPRLPPSMVARWGDQLLRAVAAALAQPPEEESRPSRGARSKYDPAVEERLVRLKALRSSRAVELGLEPGVLCPNGTLGAMAKAWVGPRTDLAAVTELRVWQRQALGEDVVRKALGG